MPFVTLLILAAIVFFALTVETIVGFGASVLTVSLGALVLPIETLLAVFVPVNLLLSLSLILRHRDAVVWPLLTRSIAPWMLVGFPLGLLLFTWRAAVHLELWLAAFVIVLGVREWIGASGRSHPLLLVLGGVAHGALGTGGPLVVYSVRRQLDDPRAIRSTLAVLWAALNLLLIASYVWNGTLTIAHTATSAWLLVPLLLAMICGEWIARRANKVIVTRLVATLLLACGAALIVKSFRGA